MSNIILREDFLVKKILLSKSEIGQEKDLAKKEKILVNLFYLQLPY